MLNRLDKQEILQKTRRQIFISKKIREFNSLRDMKIHHMLPMWTLYHSDAELDQHFE